MVMPGRNGSTDLYRYGFQGQEKDDEIKGEGNSLNYKYRMHDPRLGRFFAVDPLAPEYPHNSPYTFSENRVTDGVELEGLEYLNKTGQAMAKDYTGSLSSGSNFSNYSLNLSGNTSFSIFPSAAYYNSIGSSQGNSEGGLVTNTLGAIIKGSASFMEGSVDAPTYFGSQVPEFFGFASSFVGFVVDPSSETGGSVGNSFENWKKSNAWGYSLNGGFAKEGSFAANPSWGNGLRFVGGAMAFVPVLNMSRSVISAGLRYMSYTSYTVRPGVMMLGLKLVPRQYKPIWTSTKQFSPVQNAYNHFVKHGDEFPEFINSKQYVQGAQDFLHNPPAGTLTKFRPTNGDVLRYNPASNTFGVMDANGIPRTLFRPTDGLKYWLAL